MLTLARAPRPNLRLRPDAAIVPRRVRARWLALTIMVLAPAAGRSQQLLRPHLAWRTIETEHFAFHFPAELEAWTRHAAERMESVRETVVPLVGSAPRRRTTVIVDDPYNVANGSAYSQLSGPVIYLWPTPPDPRSPIGSTRSYVEELAVHEYAHVAHLTRPSRRRPAPRLIRLLLPGTRRHGMQRPPRWAIEGYATYVEGVLTGSGRPHGVYRPSILRQWALEGKLPTYAQLNGSFAYQGDAFAYYAGSAFLEWLAARKGDTSMVLLWRRLSARQRRSFDDAFAGVYGGLPADLYGRFTVELTARALDAERAVAASGADSGDVVQRLDWSTGNPALSADGKLLALNVRQAPNRPGRIVVWETVPAPDTMAERRRKRQLELDPEDVPAVEYRPPPRRAVSTLLPRQEREFLEPRFFADDNRLLVVRNVARGDGSLRPALFLWDRKARRVTRVRGGDGINYADPSPDGLHAVGTRCLRGSCDLVRLDLATGRMDALAAGGPARVYHRPRHSPDGRTIAFAVQTRGVWRVGTMAADGRTPPRLLTGDDASRYEAVFTRDGRALIAVSEAGGVANLERIPLEEGGAPPRTLTQVTGAAVAPEPAPDGGVYFLTLHAKGYDLRRLAADSTRPVQTVSLDPRLTPAAAMPVMAAPDTPTVRAVGPTRRYGLGPRRYRIVPTALGLAAGVPLGASTFGGWRTELNVGLGVASVDPVGRLSWIAQGVVGQKGPWRGASLRAAWRGSRPSLHGEIFHADQHPSLLNPELRGFERDFDMRYTGTTLSTSLTSELQPVRRQTLELGVSAGRLTLVGLPRGSRRVAFADYSGAFARRAGRGSTGEVVLHAATGRSLGATWRRGVVRAAFTTPFLGRRLLADGLVAGVDASAPFAEWFLYGGLPSPLVHPSVLGQRLAAPALPAGAMAFDRGGAIRLGAMLGPFRPYFSEVYAPHNARDHLSFVGVEQIARTPAISFLRIPASRVVSGWAMTVTEDVPWRRFRLYVSGQVTP